MLILVKGSISIISEVKIILIAVGLIKMTMSYVGSLFILVNGSISIYSVIFITVP